MNITSAKYQAEDGKNIGIVAVIDGENASVPLAAMDLFTIPMVEQKSVTTQETPVPATLIAQRLNAEMAL